MNAALTRRLDRLETETNETMVVIKCQPGETPEAAVARYDAENPNERPGLTVIIKNYQEAV